MIEITPEAAQQILASQPPEDEPTTMALRIAAKRAPDGTIQYGIGFDGEREGDFLFDSHGITFVVAPVSSKLLEGATLDFVETSPGEFQFIFYNPNDAHFEAGSPQDASGTGSTGHA